MAGMIAANGEDAVVLRYGPREYWVWRLRCAIYGSSVGRRYRVATGIQMYLSASKIRITLLCDRVLQANN